MAGIKNPILGQAVVRVGHMPGRSKDTYQRGTITRLTKTLIVVTAGGRDETFSLADGQQRPHASYLGANSWIVEPDHPSAVAGLLAQALGNHAARTRMASAEFEKEPTIEHAAALLLQTQQWIKRAGHDLEAVSRS